MAAPNKLVIWLGALALMAFSAIVEAMSFQATTTVQVEPIGKSAQEVVQTFASIARALAYKVGHFHSANGPTLLENDRQLQVYFVGTTNRTSLVVSVTKANGHAMAKFGEFGVRTFSERGEQEYAQVLDMLAQAFGKHAVVAQPRVLQQPNPPINADARDVPPPAEASGARAGYRAR